MRKLYQTEWFNIQFESFSDLSSTEIASERFYNGFYDQFHHKYKSYDMLPEDWKKNKNVLVEHLLDITKNKEKILSIGCGIGYIENKLSQSQSKSIITAIEPSAKASKWLDKNTLITLFQGYFPDAVSQQKFDFAYTSYVEYVFNDEMYLKFLSDIKSFPVDDFLLLGASVYTPSLTRTFKDIIRQLLSRLGISTRQFWGYQRTIAEHLHLFSKIGFKHITYGQLNNGTYWIRAQNG